MAAFLRRTAFVIGVMAIGGGAHGETLAFSPPTPLNTNAGTDSFSDSSPAIATDGKGFWVAAWTASDVDKSISSADFDVHVARSVDNGQTWTPPAALNTDAEGDSKTDSTAAITTDCKGNWVAVWLVIDDDQNFDLAVARSTDNGATWSDPFPLTHDANFDFDSSITTDKNGVWIIVWESFDLSGSRSGADEDILISRSTDNGASWSDPAPLNTNAPADNRDDFDPSITTDGQGKWVASWSSVKGKDYDIAVARSSNGGASWTAPVPLIATDSDVSEDHSLRVATDGKGNWLAAWTAFTDSTGNDSRVMTSRSMNSGQTWTAPAPINPGFASDSNFDNLMSLVTDSQGNWIAAWLSTELLDKGETGENDIEASLSTDNGASWSPPTPINTLDGNDDSFDSRPVLAADGVGNWLCAWESDDDLSDTIGGDLDILSARAFLPAVAAGIKVLVPNGGERWKVGKKKKILWEPSGKGSNVRVELLRNSRSPVEVKASTPNDGELSWKIPESLATGPGYKISVTAVDDPELTDQSDSDFRLKPAK